MNSTSRRRMALPGIAALALGLAVSACGAANEKSSGGSGDSSSGGSLSGTLNGAGSSAQQAAQAAWTADFQKQNSGVTVNYNPVGSGGGVSSFISGGVDFAGSDAALTTDQVSQATKRCGSTVIEVPDYISPIAMVFNVPGVTKLDLDAPTLAKMFNGKITKWNDPAIAALNKGVKLPDLTISPVHRSDSSGTTWNFTDYLSQASGGAWTTPANEDWPIKSGEGANGTSGVIAAVKSGKGSIAYADNSQAGSLAKASIKVGSSFVAPSAQTASQDLAVSKQSSGRGSSDLAMDVARTSSNATAYPITLASYLIACPTYSGDKAALVEKYLSYAVSTDGQQSAAGTAGSSPLPSSLQSKVAALIGGIKKG